MEKALEFALVNPSNSWFFVTVSQIWRRIFRRAILREFRWGGRQGCTRLPPSPAPSANAVSPGSAVPPVTAAPEHDTSALTQYEPPRLGAASTAEQSSDVPPASEKLAQTSREGTQSKLTLWTNYNDYPSMILKSPSYLWKTLQLLSYKKSRPNT